VLHIQFFDAQLHSVSIWLNGVCMSFKVTSRLVVLSILPLTLAGCGGGTTGVGGGGTGGAVGTAPPTNGCTTTASCNYGATATKLAGVGVLETRNLNLDVTDRSVNYGTADLNVPGDSIAYKDGNATFTANITVGDISDPDADLIAQNLSTGLVSINPDDDYEFVKGVTGNYVLSLTPYLFDGYVGLVTDVTGIPNSGVATYSGSASGGVDTGALLPELLLGTAELEADFGTGAVDLVVDFNLATDGTDYVTITGMTIDGNTFSGGDLAVYTYDAIPAENNLAASNYLGTGVSHQSTGVFFGVDENLALAGGGTTTGPDEVAGAVVATGSNAELYFTYVAD
jgi:hypothetical protein